MDEGVRPPVCGFGCGPSRFLSNDVMRSGQQAARGRDIVQLAKALGLESPILGGFDWGAMHPAQRQRYGQKTLAASYHTRATT